MLAAVAPSRCHVRRPPLAATLVLLAPLAAADTPLFEGILSRAEVTGPTGTSSMEIVALEDGRARLLQLRPGSRVELLVTPAGAWMATVAIAPPARRLHPSPFGSGYEFHREEGGEHARLVPAGEAEAAFVAGHAVHRMVLARGGRPDRLELAPAATKGSAVVIELGDWRERLGVALPFEATFRSDGKEWRHRYDAVLPFRIAPGAALPGDPADLAARLADLGDLAAAHERVMEAHRRSDATALVADEAEAGTVSGRGTLSGSTRAALRTRMEGYLGGIHFTRYEDTEVPVIAVATDGSLGWLACAMEAEGERHEGEGREEVRYAFSWVELYARAPDAPGRWLRIGNASSERPESDE